ncbi:hypothetical protein [Streptomyces arenae]|uniref:hypothetical protein n=1 Tax=Streptomyces arenae TaxID=29301 RepID=UPI002658C50D|nr:hypothetical protein [Streptomyces arenae]MCG7203830.1 hypothetical protein [Streptomyces arenae]
MRRILGAVIATAALAGVGLTGAATATATAASASASASAQSAPSYVTPSQCRQVGGTPAINTP